MKINQSLINILGPITPYELFFKIAADGDVEQVQSTEAEDCVRTSPDS